MRIDWDREKNRRNLSKHGLGFELAQQVFDDPHALSLQDRAEFGEERWQTLGLVGGVLVLLVAHTYWQTENELFVRIISARKATKTERQRYEQAH